MKRKPARSKKPSKRERFTGPIHKRIADLREERGLTQEQLAQAVGVDDTAVSHWENRIARPSITRLPAVASALGVSIEELLEGEKAA